MSIKEAVFILYYRYNRYFVINRGKAFLSNLLNKLFGTFWIKVDKEIFLELFINSSMDLSYLEKENYSHNITVLEIDKLNPGETFIDIGSNVGLLSIIASKKVGDSGLVLSFEPSYREYKRLIGNLEKNKTTNVVAYNCAIGSKNEIIKLHIEKYHTGLNKIASSFIQPEIHKDSINVPMFRLDYIVPHSKIELVKIDVEGAELLVLQGMENLLTKNLIKKLVIEITPKFLKEYGATKAELYTLLEKNNYLPKFNSNEWQYDEIFELSNAR